MKVKLFRNFKIKSKLMILEAISILGLIIVGGISIYSAQQINQASTDIQQQWLPSVIIAEDLNTDISSYRIKEYCYVLAKSNEVRTSLEADMEELKERVDLGFQSYEPLITNDTDRAMMEEARTVWNEYLIGSEKLLTMSRNNIHEKALTMLVGETDALFQKASGLFLEVVNFNKVGAEQASIHADKLYNELNRNKIVAIILITVIITVMVIYISKSLERPIEAIAEGTWRVSNGDLNVYLHYDSEDEIGVLTDAVNTLIKRLRDIIEDEKHLFYEIGNENFKAKSHCESAYRGDFAPILYSIESLKSRLEMMKFHDKDQSELPPKITREEIERLYGRYKMDASDKKRRF